MIFLTKSVMSIAGIMLALFAGCVFSAEQIEQNQLKKNTVVIKTHPRQKTYMKRRWGIDVIWVRETAAGYMLEFRYKVLDATKASKLFQRNIKPMLIHEDTGAQFIVPTPAKTGALRNSDVPIEGTTYWMFFANPAKFVNAGDLVSVQIGDYVQNHLIVQ